MAVPYHCRRNTAIIVGAIFVALKRSFHGHALQSEQAMFRKSQPLMSGFEWIIILFIGVIPFRAAEVVAEALGCSHLIALACGIVVMAICVLGYFAIRPMMLPD